MKVYQKFALELENHWALIKAERDYLPEGGEYQGTVIDEDLSKSDNLIFYTVYFVNDGKNVIEAKVQVKPDFITEILIDAEITKGQEFLGHDGSHSDELLVRAKIMNKFYKVLTSEANLP